MEIAGMPIDEMSPFIFVWIGVGVIGSLWLLVHPASWRSMYIGWRGAFGLVIDPQSPILSNTALRFYGVFVAVFVSSGGYIFIQQELDRWQQEQVQQEYDPQHTVDEMIESIREMRRQEHAEQ
ncbi:MAG: hypothetical protein AAGI37_12765 [Planctomycetota bacterium]